MYLKLRGLMNLLHCKSLFRGAVFAAFGLVVANGQTQDISGNAMLKGNFAFRYIAVQNVDANSNPTQVTATYGTITFDGAGNYNVTATSVDNTATPVSQALTVSGTYAIGSNGTGYIANPLYPTDTGSNIDGAVAQGVFTGSATEIGQENFILNDLFIAIPVGAAVPTNASFTSAYQTGLLDFTGAGVTAIKNALFELTPNGKGGFGAISLNGQASNQTAPTITQSITGATYNFNSDGSATLTVPLASGVTSTNAMFTGTKTIFQSADGNFILGWTSAGYDIFFGVKALNGTGTNKLSTGLYFNAGLEDSPSLTSGSGADSFYGSINNSGDSVGDGILHARLNFPNSLAFDYGTDDQIDLNADGTTGPNPDFNGYLYAFGDGGQAYVAIGTGGNFSLSVGLHAATFSGPGVYLNPIGVANAASYQPITASLAPGELITLVGTGLSGVTLTTTGGQKFPLVLGGVSVTVDSIPCPIYYVSPTQLSVIVPYGLTSSGTIYANIQVTNNGVQSKVVQTYFQDTAPGAFSQTANGIGLASARHAATGQPVTAANPAQKGEYISLYLTGLGTVTPTVADGALGPTSPLSTADVNTQLNLTVLFNDYGSNGTTGNSGKIQFAGLAPGLAGLYQINVQVPTTGLVPGDNVYVELITDTADVNQIQIPYGSSSSSGGTAVRPARSFGVAARTQAMRAQGHKRLTRPARGGKTAGRCASGAWLGTDHVCIP